MKYVAYGMSKLLLMYMDHHEGNDKFDYIIDNFTDIKEISGIPVYTESKLDSESLDDLMIILFAVSNTSIIKIEEGLVSRGLVRYKNFMYYSDFFLDNFNEKMVDNGLGELTDANYLLALEMNRNLNIPVHTTILGNALLLHLIDLTVNLVSPIVEIGAYRCGASKINMFKLLLNNDLRKYYIFDSFEGFPILSKKDPESFKSGDYSTDIAFESIENEFLSNDRFKLVKGFVPDTFTYLNEEDCFSIVFYDADLYQPALDTFAYFDGKIEKGGFLVIHDYEAEKNGFTGVKKATTEYFSDKDVNVFSFYENTIAVVRF